ncbi:MAG: hypothetical protein H7A53_08840 [Akkermansiaceae bacterium]|nr:hypothetical protein [Akkermansiaceae bacterium]
MKKLSLLLLVSALAAGSTIPVLARTWTRSTDQKTIEGEFVRMKDDKTAFIKTADGRTVEIPLAMLVAEDQAFIKEAATTASATDEGKKEPPKGETTVTLSGAHLCCGSCKKGVESAVGGLEDITVSMTSDSITVAGKSGDKVQEALDAIAKAGYYGKSDNETVLIADAKSSDEEKDSVTVTGVHLCCGKCVKAIANVVSAVGADKHTAEKGSSEFQITGKVKPSAVLAALRAEGLNGTVK